jgi:hypothetical protein
MGDWRLRTLQRAAIGVGLLIGAGVLTLGVLSLQFAKRGVPLEEPLGSEPARSVRADTIGDFIRERMRPASAAFFAPSPMTRDEPVEAVLEISPPSVDPKTLESELRARASRNGVAASDSIRIAPRMVASLVSDRDATIVAKDALDRAIVFGERARWRWTITPHGRDPVTLTALLKAPVVYDGQETGYEVKTFEKTVVVTVTTQQQLSDLWIGARDNWVLLAACAAALGAVGRWLLGRLKRQRRSAGFSTT